MGKKDILDRSWFSDPRRFAELINVGFYQGRKIIRPEDLVVLNRKYPSLSDASGEKERDILMKDRRRRICYGLEIETEFDYSMPERVMVYDACEYEYQIREIQRWHRKCRDYKNYREWKSRVKKGDLLLAVMTGVLYLGEGHWEGRRKLSQMFHLLSLSEEDGLCRFQEYEYSLIEADYGDPEVYETDLREFFQAMQCRRDKERLKELFRLERFQQLDPETERIIAVHLNIKNLVHKMEKEELPMCKAFEELMEDERREGKREGERKGLKKGHRAGARETRVRIVRRMVRAGMDKNLIRELTQCTAKELAEAGKARK